MTMIELFEEYFENKRTAINLIRVISGMFNPEHSTYLLTLICQVARMEEGDLDKETFKQIWFKQKEKNDETIE